MQNEKIIKACHVITRFIIGGAQENTLFTVRGLAKMPNYEVTLVTGPSPGPEGSLEYQLTEDELFTLVHARSLIRALHPVKDIKACIFLYRFFKKNNFDIVHTHSSKAGILARIAARFADVKVIVHTIHGLPYHRYQNAVLNSMYILSEKIAARCSDKIISVSDAMTVQALQAGIAKPEKYVTIRSGMELDAFLNTRPDKILKKKLGIQETDLVVGKIARLFYLKGHEYLFAVIKQIVAEFPNVKFLMIGDGLLKEQFEKELEKEDIKEYVIFAGLIMPEDIPRYIAIMDILVHVSLREGLAKAIPQALAAGKPVVAFNLDGTPELVIPEKTGYLVEPGDTKSLMNKILLLLKNAQVRDNMGKKSREIVDPEYRWQDMVARIDRLYKKLIRAKR